MANSDSKPKAHTTQPGNATTLRECSQRYYTVGYRPNRGKPNPLPQLTIKGRWLEQLGFTTGLPVIVTAERGRLVIEIER